MLKKSMAAVVMVMVFALALAGCGGSDGAEAVIQYCDDAYTEW